MTEQLTLEEATIEQLTDELGKRSEACVVSMIQPDKSRKSWVTFRTLWRGEGTFLSMGLLSFSRRQLCRAFEGKQSYGRRGIVTRTKRPVSKEERYAMATIIGWWIVVLLCGFGAGVLTSRVWLQT